MSEDLISRKAAIDAIWDGTNMDIYTREVKEILEGLPSAPPVCIAEVTFDKAEMEKIIKDLIKEMEISVTDWIPVSEGLPEKGGDYLVTQKAAFSDYVYINVIGYALNLHDVDEYDFADKKRPGWHEYDPEWGYRELDDVVAWMPLPEPYKAESEG